MEHSSFEPTLLWAVVLLPLLGFVVNGLIAFKAPTRKILTTIIDKFSGGPVGVETLCSAVSEERETIEDVYEPYLLQCGYLQRTPRGRVATPLAYRHLGRPAASTAKGGQSQLDFK